MFWGWQNELCSSAVRCVHHTDFTADLFCLSKIFAGTELQKHAGIYTRTYFSHFMTKLPDWWPVSSVSTTFDLKVTRCGGPGVFWVLDSCWEFLVLVFLLPVLLSWRLFFVFLLCFVFGFVPRLPSGQSSAVIRVRVTQQLFWGRGHWDVQNLGYR